MYYLVRDKLNFIDIDNSMRSSLDFTVVKRPPRIIYTTFVVKNIYDIVNHL